MTPVQLLELLNPSYIHLCLLEEMRGVCVESFRGSYGAPYVSRVPCLGGEEIGAQGLHRAILGFSSPF